MRIRLRGSPSWPGNAHRARELLVRQRTQAINALRGLLGEFGICEPQGIWHLGRLRAHLEDDTVPEPGRKVLSLLVEQLNEVEKRIAQVEAEIRTWHRSNPVSQRLGHTQERVNRV